MSGLGRASLAAAFIVVSAGGASAAVSFKGKTITINVAGTSGGGIDIGARMIAPLLAKYLPGGPNVVVQEMPGAGGVRALNYLAAEAPRDGTVMAAFAPGPMLAPILGPYKSNVGIDQFTAIGALDRDNALCTTWYTSPIKTLDDARKHVVRVAGTGAGSDTDTQPVVLNYVLGTKFKVITGYLGTRETAMAVERGEVDGRCGFGYNSMKASVPEWIKDHKLNYLVQMGLEAHPLMPNVPLAINLADTPAKKAMIRLMSSPEEISHPYLAPPGVPAPTAEALRKAFMQAVDDPQFVAEFKKTSRGEPPHPTDGAGVQKILAGMQATPAPVVARLRALLKTTPKK